MEAGNLLFGNSRGEFPIDRNRWDSIFAPLFAAVAEIKGQEEFGGYLTYFENDTFKLRPYDWGAECDCGFEDEAEAMHAETPHTETCFHTRLSKLYFGEWNEEAYDDKQVLLADFLRREGVSENGCMVRCDCGVQAVIDAFFQAHDHAEACRLVQPNFLHKPSGYRFNVYKYAFRDSYANKKLTTKQARAIVSDCLNSLSKEPAHV